MTGEWQAHTGLVSTTTAPRVQYAYSKGVGGNHSRLTRITYPDGYQVNYAYVAGIDAAVSRPTSLSGQQAGSTAAVTLEAFKYLGAGTVIERSRPEVNVTLSMVNFSGATADAGDKYTGLDRFGRVADQRWTQGTTATSPVLDRYGYTYDRNSNRLTRSNPLAAAFSETYAYDALNQLQSFSQGHTPTPTTSQQWQFDALGNWTTVTTDGVANTPRTVNAQNELTQASGKTLTYTPTGSMATDVQGRTFTYDAWNRLVSVKNATGTEVARYEYDGLARRIVERVGTLAAPAAAAAPVRDVYYSQNWQVLEERLRTPAGAIPTTADTRFVWSPVYVDAMVVRDRNADGNTTTGTGGLEQRVYALQDANWNTTAIIAAAGVPGVAAGAVVNRFIYAPYGRSDVLTAAWATAGATTPTPWAHRFQGLEFTDVTALAYARNRDYSFALGRFIQLDPIGFSAGDNNWYRFVANGPTGKVDPSGLAEGYNSINEWLTGPVPGFSQADIEQIEQLERMLRARPSQPSPTGFVPWQGRNGEVSCIGRMHRASGHSPDGHPISGSAALDAVQAGLDLVGLVPGAGEVFDGLNGLISLGRGDYTGAGLSFAAMVPVGGQAATAAKFGLKYGDEVAAAGRCAAPKGALSEADRVRIQNFADKYDTDVHVVGSRASGTSRPNSDYDYILGESGGNSRLRQKARRDLPRGTSGGEIHPSRGETGIDVFNEPLDPTRPHITIRPNRPGG